MHKTRRNRDAVRRFWVVSDGPDTLTYTPPGKRECDSESLFPQDFNAPLSETRPASDAGTTFVDNSGDQELREGNYETFGSMDDLIGDLDAD